MTFAPMILVQCSIAVVAFGYMLSINVPLALIAMVDHAVRLHRRASSMRQVDVPGVVAHPGAPGRRGHHRRREHQRGPGGEVVRRRAAAAATRWPRQPTRCSGATSKTPTCGPGGRRRVQNLPQVGLALVLLVRRVHGHPWPASGGGHPGLQRLPAHAAGAVHDARDDHHDGPARRGVSRPHLRDPGRAADGRRPARRRRPRRLPGRRALRERWASPTAPTTPLVLSRLQPPSPPGRDGGPGGTDGLGQVDRGAAAPPLLRRHRGRLRIDGHDVRDLTLASLRAQCRDRPRRAVPVLGVHPGQHRLRAPRRRHGRHRSGGARRRGRRVHPRPSRRLRHRRR